MLFATSGAIASFAVLFAARVFDGPDVIACLPRLLFLFVFGQFMTSSWRKPYYVLVLRLSNKDRPAARLSTNLLVLRAAFQTKSAYRLASQMLCVRG